MYVLANGGTISDPSALVRSICDYEAALRLGLSVTYEDLTEEEFMGLAMLHEARILAANKKLEMDKQKRIAHPYLRR